METGNKTVSDIVTLVKSWLPWQPETANISRDFWMPDHICRVCYSCDSQFTLFNRRHHCRLCGRVFCARCTSNSVPASAMNTTPPREDSERIRVCNYCFKQYEQNVATRSNAFQASDQDISNSLSAASYITSKTALTINSGSYTLGSTPYPVGSYQRVQQSPYHGHHQSSSKLNTDISEPHEADSGRLNPSGTNTTNMCSNIYGFSPNRSEYEDDEYSVCPSELEAKRLSPENSYFGPAEFNGINDGSPGSQHDRENADSKSFSSSPLIYSFHSPGRDVIQQVEKKDGNDGGYECEASSSLYAAADVDAEPVDFENNGLLWLPPEPEDLDDEREGALFYDDDDDDGDATGEWGCMHSSSSVGSGDCNGSDRSSEEPKSARSNMVDGHFRALVAQLLQVENLPVDGEANEESWLEIITALSWEAATLLKLDMSIGGGMDPGEYVKVKCIASGCRSESMVVKGVVCKKNVAHRRMTSKLDKPRLLILGGGLEYHRVSNRLSSFDTLLKQELDHLKIAVAKIDAHHPDVLLVEKSVSRFAQDYLLEKGIPLVLNIKRALLERIARCTGGQIVPSVDHLSSPKLGYCEKFHVERFLEDLGIDGKEGKRSVRTLMYFEGCPKPLGFTILLKGANQLELKKVKHVVQYGVFAAYHLARETSFLADEGASVPEFPSNSQIPVAFPDKTTTIQRSISTIPGFTGSANEKSQEPLGSSGPERSNSVPIEGLMLSLMKEPTQETEVVQPPGLPRGPKPCKQPTLSHTDPIVLFSSSSAEKDIPEKDILEKFSMKDFMESKENLEVSVSNNGSNIMVDNTNANQSVYSLQNRKLSFVGNGDQKDRSSESIATQVGLDVSSMQQESNSFPEAGTVKEEFPPSPSDHQSILVSLSSRCVWKGTVCERSHLFRIKYYGSFDKPLGRFLRDHLFDQTYRCHSCTMPAEAHVHCYTHRQGTLTISVKKLPEVLLPGEKDGKIWMWHRCLRCPRTNGFPPATRRIVMSDAAWGLSFGKFLELSFSNNAAASRVATCGHSLQRDCLRFYGFGNMVACFRYASISVYSVFLPPSKVDFDYGIQEWIKKETDEVNDRAELLFSEVRNALQKIAEKKFGRHACDCAMEMHESMRHIAELLGMLQKEKDEFEESLQKALHKEVREMQPVIDILDINRLRRQLLFQSYVWDHRLINAANADNSSSQDSMAYAISESDKKLAGTEKVNEISMLADLAKVPTPDTLKTDSGQGLEETCGDSVNQSLAFDHKRAMSEGLNYGEEDEASLSATRSMYDRSENIESSGSFRRVLSDGQFPVIDQLSETLDAAWTGEYNRGTTIRKYRSCSLSESAVGDLSHVTTEADCVDSQESQHLAEDRTGPKIVHSPSQALSTKSENAEDAVGWIGMPFLSLYRSLNKNTLANTKKLDELGDYSPVYVSSFRQLELQAGSRLLLPACLNETVIPVYDDEPTSIVSYALLTPEYHSHFGDDGDRHREYGDSVTSVPASDLMHHQSPGASDETISNPHRNFPSADEHSMAGTRNPLHVDPVSSTKGSHPRVSFVKYSVTFYYAKQFEALRRICCPEQDFVRSLSRCRNWGAQGGKSNVFFAKTLDDRFIIKQVTKTELESFIKYAPVYFRYLMESITTRSPTCLAKILGIYQIAIKQLKGTKESKMDVLVMENVLFRRNVVRLYDLKGSSRSRYNADSSGKNKVLLDQNLIEAMPTSPIFVGNKAKRILERAVWNDTAFLASVDVMDYSLLVGVDEEKHELVLGIIDFIRQYTWDKHLETWVKASGILGGPKNTPPTVISPKQYKKRFRKAMTTYFLMIPDQWSTCEEGRASTE